MSAPRPVLVTLERDGDLKAVYVERDGYPGPHAEITFDARTWIVHTHTRGWFRGNRVVQVTASPA